MENIMVSVIIFACKMLNGICKNGFINVDVICKEIVCPALQKLLNFIQIINSLYCFSGKAALITVGSLVVGAVIGSTVESLLQVDVVPFFGIRSPAVIISEFVLFSQLVTSLYLR
jgi:Protein CHAPERONE-LIKE PROTEIN OF POR1-like